MAKFNGHKNWNHWNVSLWINNDEGLYDLARKCIRLTANRSEAVDMFLAQVVEISHTETPDGAPYSKSAVRAALVGM